MEAGKVQLVGRRARSVILERTKTTAAEAPAIRALKETINQRRERQAALNVRPDRMETGQVQLVGRHAKSARSATASPTVEGALAIRCAEEDCHSRSSKARYLDAVVFISGASEVGTNTLRPIFDGGYMASR